MTEPRDSGSPDTPLLGPGKVFQGYALLEQLGQGGMGAVYKARQLHLDRLVAIKLIRQDRAFSPQIKQRFQREARAAARLSHPHVVAVHDAGLAGDIHYLVMEYLEGTDLGSLVRRQGPLPVSAACRFLFQAALGLDHVHACGLVHRDIKPGNLFLTRPGNTVKLIDLGLARLLRDPTAPSSASELTQPGDILGTVDFMSPEQASDSRTADIRADIYSLGCTLYYLLTGSPPFPGGTLVEKLLRHQTQTPAAIESLCPDISLALAEVIRRMMARRPEDRYQTPAEAAAALQPFAEEGETITASAPSTPGGVPPSTITMQPGAASEKPPQDRMHERTRTRTWALAAAALLLLLVASGTFWIYRSKGERALPREDTHRLQTGSTAGEGQQGGEEVKLPILPVVVQAVDAREILPEEACAGKPAGDLVAVLGDPRWRAWGEVRCLAISRDGKVIACTCDQPAIYLWEAATGSLLRVLRGHKHKVTGLAFDRAGNLYSAGQDNRIRYWQTASGQLKSTWEDESGAFGLALAADDSLLALPCVDGKVRLWDTQRGQRIASFAGHIGSVQTVAFSPDGATLASAGEDGTVRLWNPRAQAAGPVLRGHTQKVYCLAFSLDGKELASGGIDGDLYLWSIPGGKAIGRLSHSLTEGRIYAVVYLPGGLLASSDHFGVIHLWDRAKSKKLRTLQGHAGPVAALALHPQGKLLFSGGDDCTLRRWSLPDGTEQSAGDGHLGPVSCIAVHSEGRWVASGGVDAHVRMWDLPRRASLAGLPAHRGGLLSAAFIPGTDLFASGGFDGIVKLWSMREKRQVGDLVDTMEDFPWGLAFTPDGKTAAIASRSRRVQLWTVSARKRERTLSVVSGGVGAIAWSPDAKRLAVGQGDWETPGKILLWDVDTDRVQRTLAGHGRTVSGVGFSPDGGTLISSGWDGEVVVWDTASGQPRARCRGHTEAVIAFAAFGPLAATADREGHIYLWNTQTGRSLAGWRMPGEVRSLAFVPGAQLLISGNSNGTLALLRF
jgi:WD40 repeat protein/serine/threonine protein kinase